MLLGLCMCFQFVLSVCFVWLCFRVSFSGWWDGPSTPMVCCVCVVPGSVKMSLRVSFIWEPNTSICWGTCLRLVVTSFMNFLLGLLFAGILNICNRQLLFVYTFVRDSLACSFLGSFLSFSLRTVKVRCCSQLFWHNGWLHGSSSNPDEVWRLAPFICPRPMWPSGGSMRVHHTDICMDLLSESLFVGTLNICDQQLLFDCTFCPRCSDMLPSRSLLSFSFRAVKVCCWFKVLSCIRAGSTRPRASLTRCGGWANIYLP